MKKIFKISLVSLLAVMPMVAGAEPVAGEPVAGNSNSPTASSAPKYALAPANSETDNKVATAGYVKGAYNAIIKGINKTQEGVDTLNADITTHENTIDHLLDGKATQTGTVATINNARTTESIETSTVSPDTVTTTSISATASGNVKLSVTMMSDWGNDAVAASPLRATTSFSGLPLNGLTMGAPLSNTATLTKSGIGGTVTVAEYVTQAINAGTFDFTQLIDVNGDSSASKSANGSETEGDISGLSNGEWKVTWNDYGTVLGMSQCSSRSASDLWTTEEFVLQPDDTTSTLPDATGSNCYCKMTGWTPSGGTETPAASLWVFYYTSRSDSYCASYCADNCGSVFRYNSAWRSGLFGTVQN